MLANMKIGARLYAAFAAVIAVLILLVTISYRNMASLDEANAMNVHTYEVLGEAEGMLEALINIETGQRGFALTGNEASLEPLTLGQRQFAAHLAAARKLTADNPAQQQRLAQLEQAQQDWMRVAITPALAMRRAAAGGGSTLEDVSAFERKGAGKAAMDTMRGLLADTMAAEEQLLKARKAGSAALQSRTNMFLIGGGVFAVAAAATIAWLLSGSITRPLSSAVALAQRVARGDLTSRIEATSRDEVGALLAALAEMNRALAGIVGTVRQGTDAIATASAEIATGNLDLSARTEQQASSLEETASSMEELTSTVRQNADHARAASRLADDTSGIAARSGAIVQDVVQTMQRISAASDRIADIIGVIDGIAFQTNILALNAAVEAARAGEQGRGFAVVAGEVRTLAHRSAAAAKEIKDLIGNAADEVRTGTQLVNQAGATIGELVAGVREVGATMGQISAASGEQLAGIEQVNAAVVQMDNVTQQNAALVEEAAAAAAALQEQARKLEEVVSVFTIPAAASAAGSGLATLPRQPVPALAQ